MIEPLESELRSALRARADDLPTEARARVRARDYHPRTRDIRPPVAAGALVTAAAAAAAVALVDLGPSTSEAFAGWTRVPTHASAAQVGSATSSCRSQLAAPPPPGAVSPTKPTGLPDVRAMTPVLTDTRGPFTFVIFAGARNASAWCISGPNFTSTSIRSDADTAAPPAAQIIPTFQEHTARAGDAYSFIEGHAGSGVTAATLVLSDGSKVQATIQNGWLVAWWPGSAQLTSAQVTTASGTSTQTFKSQSASQCPPPPGAPTTAATMCSGGFDGTGKGQAAGSVSVRGANSGQGPASGSTATNRTGN